MDMTDMDQRDADQAAHDQLMSERRERLMDALRTAKARGVPEEDLMVLAHEGGVANDFYKEIRL